MARSKKRAQSWIILLFISQKAADTFKMNKFTNLEVENLFDYEVSVSSINIARGEGVRE